MVAVRDNMFGYKSVVTRDGAEVFTMKMGAMSMSDNGVMTIAGCPGEYNLTHKSMSGRWPAATTGVHGASCRGRPTVGQQGLWDRERKLKRN